MATGSAALETMRGAIEAAEGDAATPTRFLYPGPNGSVQIIRAGETIYDSRTWNKFDAIADVYEGIRDVQVRVSNVPLSYQDAGFWMSTFDAALSGAPSLTDTSAYTRTGNVSQTANTVGATGQRSLHLQWSASDFASTAVWKVPGLVGEELSIQFNARASGNDTGCLATMLFRTASDATLGTSFDGSLSDRAQSMVIGTHLKSYLDTSTMGSTADTNVTAATFTLRRPAVFHDGMSGTGRHTSMHRPDAWETMLTFTRKFSDLTEHDAVYAKTLRKMRILAEGALVGASTALNTFRLDFVGKHEPMGEIPSRVNGLWYAEHTLRGVYDATLGASWEFYSINGVSAAYTSA